MPRHQLRPVPEPTPPARPLAITGDEQLTDQLGRIAAAAGVDLLVTSDPPVIRRDYAGAPLIIVGDDLAPVIACAGLPRRAGVLLVGRDLDDGDVWQRGVRLGAEDVLHLPDHERYLAQRLADVAEGGGGRGHRVVVVGGRGGAGASTLAGALAVTGARAGLATMLVDGDPLGGGIDLVLGEEETGGMRWPALVDTDGRISGQALRAELPRADAAGVTELAVLSWDRGDLLTVPRPAMRAVLDAGERAHDLVVVDLPRACDEAGVEALTGAAVTLLLVPAEVRAVAAAGRVLTGLRRVTSRIQLVVRGPAPSGLPAESIAGSLGLELAGEISAEPGLAGMLDRGQAPPRRRGPLAAFCAEFVADLVPSPGYGRVA